jgi:uncharacterized protein (TIGR03437 family)
VSLSRLIAGFASTSLLCAAGLTITSTTPLPNGQFGVPYSYTFGATNGPQPYTWTQVGGALPNGLTLTLQGALTGTPATGGVTSNFTVQVMDATTQKVSASFALTVNAAGGLTITNPSPLPSALLFAPYSQMFNATGGTQPYLFSVSSGSLPMGLNLTTAGALTGSATLTGTWMFDIQVQDSSTTPLPPATKTFSLTVNPPPPPLTINNPSPLPPAPLFSTYSQTFNASGGTPPYTWLVSLGPLPPGLTLTTAGALTGSATMTGTWMFDIKVQDSSGTQLPPVTKTFSLTVNSPQPPVTIINGTPLPPAALGQAYSQTLNGAGGTAPYTWSLLNGALPPGLTLTPAGVLSGSPTTLGTWDLVIKAQESSAAQVVGTKGFSLTVNGPPLMVPKPFLDPSTVGAPYTRSLIAVGGAPPYTWLIVSGATPPGVTMNTSGVLSGTPTAAGLHTFDVKVSDSGVPIQSSFTLTVQAYINPVLDFGITSPLPPGVVGIPYSYIFPGSGGTPPISGLVVLGALPPGLALGAGNSSGTPVAPPPSGGTVSGPPPPGGAGISGTPTTAGNFSFTLRATDGSGIVVNADFAIAINPRIAITTSSPLPPGTVGVAYKYNLSSSGGAPPVVWTVSAGSLPTGLTFNAAGLLSGTPAAAPGGVFTVQGADANGELVTKQLTLSIAAALVISTSELPGGNVGVNYSGALVGAGGTTPYSWTLDSGALPGGVTLSKSGRLSGIPSTAGAFKFSVLLTDSAQVTATAPFPLTIAPELKITSASSLPAGTMGKPYFQTLAATGGTPPYIWSVSVGALPAGLTLASSSGVINGSPSASGPFSFTAQIKDSAGITSSSSLSLTVASLPAIGTVSPLPSAVTGTPYQQSLSASGGTSPYRWSLQAGALPEGLTLDAQSGGIGGKPTSPGRANFTAQVTDSGGATASKAFELLVSQTLQVTPTLLSFRGSSTSQSIQILSSTAGAPVAISVNAAWLQASAAHAVSPAAIAITADPRGIAAGTYQGSVTVTSGDTRQSVSVTLTVEPSATPAPFDLSPTTLDFAFARDSAASSQTLRMTGPPASATVSGGGGWLSVSPPSAGTLVVTANPAGLAAGIYSGRILAGGATVPVTMSINAAAQSIVLTQTGLTFTAVAGFSGTLSRSLGVLNAGQGSMNWSARTSSLSGGSSWLAATPASAASDSAGRAATIDVSIAPAGLAPGDYYGQVAVTAPLAGNSPQLVSIVLNVLPADQSPGAQVYPSGLLFIATAGGPNPDPQQVTLTNVAASSAPYTSSKSAVDSANWITLTPAVGSVPAGVSSRIAVQPNIAGLSGGVHEGALTLRFGDGSSRTVNIVLVLRAGTAAKSPSAAGCNPAKLVPIFKSLGADFNLPASWPSALEMIVVDDCGEPLTAGTVVTTFSNGDPPLAMTALREGNWSGTWTPRGQSASGIAVTGQSRNSGGNLQGTVRVSGGVRANPNPPLISPNGIVSSASFALAPLAPGSLVAIFGTNLAEGDLSAVSLPLPTELGQTQVLVGARELPLIFVSAGQINAVLPYDIAVNTRQQIIVRRGTSYTMPETVTLTLAEPSVFTKDQSGQGEGLVFDAKFRAVDESNPAASGDTIVIYTTGLGEVTPPIPAGMPAPVDSLYPTASPVTVTIGGVNAPLVLFAGLAPGFTGLYQVNVVVPDGVTPGAAVPVIISAADRPGPAVTIAVGQAGRLPSNVFTPSAALSGGRESPPPSKQKTRETPAAPSSIE